MAKKQENLLDAVMQSIETEEVKMRSKWFFAVLSALLFISTCFVVIAVSVILSTIWNDIDVARTASVLDFGSPGRAFMLRNAPWILFLAVTAMVVALYHLLGKFDISYKYRHLTPVMLGTGLIFSGLVLSTTGFNGYISEKSIDRFSTLREALNEGYLEGEIVGIEDSYIKVLTEEGQHKIRLPQNRIREKLPDVIRVGGEVKVFGGFKDDEFEAYGIIPPNIKQLQKDVKGYKTDSYRGK